MQHRIVTSSPRHTESPIEPARPWCPPQMDHFVELDNTTSQRRTNVGSLNAIGNLLITTVQTLENELKRGGSVCNRIYTSTSNLLIIISVHIRSCHMRYLELYLVLL